MIADPFLSNAQLNGQKRCEDNIRIGLQPTLSATGSQEGATEGVFGSDAGSAPH